MRRVSTLATGLFAALLLAGGLVFLASGGLDNKPPPPPARVIDPATLPAGPARKLAAALQKRAPTLNAAPEEEIYVAIRAAGQRVGEGTFPLDGGYQATAIDAVVKLLEQVPEAGRKRIDAVELCLPYGFRGARMRTNRGVEGYVHRGVRGVRFKHGGQRGLYCPTNMIARNVDFLDAQRDFARSLAIPMPRLVDEGEAELFDAHQLLVELGDKPRVHHMFRGNITVPDSAVNRDSTVALADGMASWLLTALQDDGRMVYTYWPSRGRESNGNNMIRQFMATAALVRLGNYRNDPAITAAAARNMRYNLGQFYRTDGDLGMITWRNKSKLGAGALAALGIVEAPFRAELKEYEDALVRFTDAMQKDSGRFITFYGDEKRDDNHNFYPGETLLLWAFLMEKQETPDPVRMERFMRAFRHYREWHRDNRNPAFIPWHTQAYYMVWKMTKDDELKDFVFEMNDFLCDFQQYDDVRYDDELGRFHDPNRRHFGPPHASSTGVYLEGLIDAYRLAVDVGDEARAERYRRTMLRAIRSLMQLQFVDDVDTYYISRKQAVLGGIRTQVYNNTIRVDNVQHSLMGLMKLIPTFDETRAW